MSPSTQFIELLKARRTIYALEAKSPIPDSKIQEIVEQAILHVPSSFNSQTTRVVLLFKGEHEKLWNITEEVLKGVVPPEQFEGTAKRIGGFRNGYGTVLFFEDRSAVQKSDAITQYAIWVALEAEGLGANLQHYNPLIDAKVAAEWNIPADWELNAQLVFGTPLAPAGEKTFCPNRGSIQGFRCLDWGWDERHKACIRDTRNVGERMRIHMRKAHSIIP
ncbi:hypothetical protein EYC84_002044 [Monilinia fructicola]|uniref:Nitroreductase domain-containing protein n=1 Tax=Monilinia fructicola TaxID=38448 RepID=A0A5M9JW68_MONFR|nr:hypothetical protein EYC84_002044 [Monilinia fructicola]